MFTLSVYRSQGGTFAQARLFVNAAMHIYALQLRYTNDKQLLDEVFVISGIINVEVSVISRAEGRG